MRKSSGRLCGGFAAALLAAVAAAAPAAAGPLVRGEVVASPGLDRAAVRVELHVLPTPYEALRGQVPGEAEAPRLAVARLGDDGAFRLQAPAPGTYRVIARAPGRVPMAWELVPLVDDRTLPPVELPAAAAVPVRVRDPQGRAVAGARVIVRFGRGELWRPERRRGWRPLRQPATTDAAGRALAPHAAGEEELTIDAFAAGWQGASAIAAAGGEVALVLRPGVEREVEVRRRSGPVPRAALWVVADGGQRVIADERGRGRLVLPEGESVELRVESPDGWRGHYRVRVERPGEDEAPPPLRLVLHPPLHLPLRIVAADGGEPLPGALAWMSGAAGAAVAAADDGVALLAVPAEEDVEVHAAAGGFQRLSLDLPAAERPAAGKPLVLPLAARGVVAGVVVDPSGEPIAGARVLLRLRWARETAWDPARRGVEVAETDAEGRFRIATAPTRGEVLLRAEAPGLATVEATAALGATDMRLVLGAGGAVSGRLRAADGGAVEGGEVRLFPAAEPRQIQRDEDGERVGGLAAVPHTAGLFRFPQVAAGMHELVARVPGHQPLVVPGIEVAEGGEVDLGRLDLRPEAVLDGRVLDAEGEPIVGAKVTVEQAWIGFRSPSLGNRGREVVSDEQGRFRLGGLSEGTPLGVRTEAEGFVSAARHDVLLPRDEPLEIRLGRGGTVFGQVVDAAGEPLAGARLEVRIDRTADARRRSTSTWHSAGGETGEDGRFEIAGVAAAPLEVLVRHPRRRLWHEQPIGEVGEGERVGPLRIEVPASVEVTGRVRRGDGAPAAGARVRAIQQGPGGGSSFTVSADALGRFRFPFLRRGPHRVEATLGFEGRAEAEVMADAEPVELELVLEPTTGIGGRVVDPEGRPVGHGLVRLRHDGGEQVARQEERTIQLDERGRFEVVGLDEGSYRLAAEVDGLGRAEHPHPVVVRRGTPVEGLVIALAPGARIAGRVVGIARDDLPQLRIVVSEEASHVGSSVPARADGTFEVRGLPGGRHTLSASLWHTGRQESLVVEVAAGESVEGLEIDLSGLTLTLDLTVLGRPHDQPAWIVGPDGRRGAGTRRLGPGRVAFEGLAPGDHQVFLRASPAGPHHVREVEVTGDQELALDFEGWPVTGWVLDEGGAPVPGVGVLVFGIDAATSSAPLSPQGILTDAAGAFELPAVPPGSWRLVAADGAWRGEARVEVPPGGAAGLVMTVRPRDEAADPAP